mmetsp:Transcript_149149/g.260571  ORF Transcript_149149/g.260571 Transcript_149149/m.260571 type:complete len:81 (+) Transcript_149149:77-319(+)
MHHGSVPVPYVEYIRQSYALVGMEHGGDILVQAGDGRRQDGRERGDRPKQKRKRGEQSNSRGFDFSVNQQDPNSGPTHCR